MKNEILNEFESKIHVYNRFKDKSLSLLNDLLKQKKIAFHNIDGRVKNYESLSSKIDRKSEKYKCLSDITDLVGIRITSYLESDVDLIDKLIRDEFQIDNDNSIDKRILNSDQFGYKSLHLVVELDNRRLQLYENSDFKNLKIEIQIRSILQHAWAEIEHDLGYKGKAQIPDDYKRSFNRLSALLELADQEFVRLKRDLVKFESKVTEQIIREPQNVLINFASLKQFNSENSIIIEARDLLANKVGWEYLSRSNSFVDLVQRFDFFNMLTIEDIQKELKINKDLFFSFLKVFTDGFTYKSISYDIIIYYLQHFLAAKTKDKLYIQKYLMESSQVSIDGDPIDFIRIIEVAESRLKL
ncbi:GTP pyrophosphokinase family protein [Sphingobacterium sp. R2]|uniref:GTP pyrophosphokinase n=1 Tax=Sphingobacterium sp. R2 TaxID=3112958 RepID=UPI00345CFAEE